jgi:sugar lactone lactonase YvrE
MKDMPMTHRVLGATVALTLIAAGPTAAADWLLGTAYKLPSEYTNQESGYFSIVEGKNGKLYVGAAKYGVNAYLLEFDPATGNTAMVVDAHKVIGTTATGFAAQAKFHTRNAVGASGKIYVGTKQGYPEKGENRDLYPGGYVIAYDPSTGTAEHFGIARPRHGIICVVPDEARGLAYVSTCSDDRPIDHTHFLVLDLKAKTYRDLGDLEHAYAFIVLDDRGRAYHPKRGGTVVRYDPAAGKAEELTVAVNGQPVPRELAKDGAIQNWDATRDGKALYCVEMTTNRLYSFDLTAGGATLAGKALGPLLPNAAATDCRAMCVGPDGRVWAAVTEQKRQAGPLLHLVSYTPGAKAPVDHGPVGVKNPDYTTFVGPDGKPKPWHHTMRTEKDGTLTPWQPMGVCAAADGSVYVMTIAPFTLMRFDQFKK